jgi:hypothetical protein
VREISSCWSVHHMMFVLSAKYHKNLCKMLFLPSTHHYSLYSISSAIVADTFISNYWTILLFSLLCYLPGLILIALVAKPYLFGDTFPMKPMYAAYLFFYPCGAGAIKTCVNIMGAQQFVSTICANYFVRLCSIT